MQYLRNPLATPTALYGAERQQILSRTAFEAAEAVITTWPGYAPTPLVALPALARAADVAEVWLKDETRRLGLGSFKALGGAYAVFRLLEGTLTQQTRHPVSSLGLMQGHYQDATAALTVTCASAGNHGKSVAWGARMFGCRCVIYLADNVEQIRADAIAQYGADIVRVAGTYDEAVRQAARDAAEKGWHVISDTAYPGYQEIPKTVMQGYTLMAEEIIRQGPQEMPPTHVFVQCGVGGLAAALCAHFWETWGLHRPRFIVVEPEQAACMYASARKGTPTTVTGDLDTMMTCLACGDVSLLAWQILKHGADDFLTITDEAEREALTLLHQGIGNDPPLHIGPSGAAGFAAFRAAYKNDALRRSLNLDAQSRILLIGSEGV